jgi:hypothetical protein
MLRLNPDIATIIRGAVCDEQTRIRSHARRGIGSGQHAPAVTRTGHRTLWGAFLHLPHLMSRRRAHPAALDHKGSHRPP